MPDDKMEGRVTRMVFDRGYGFVRGDDDRLPRFFHVKDMLIPADFDLLKEGKTRVRFIPADLNREALSTNARAGGNGLRAKDVEVIEW